MGREFKKVLILSDYGSVEIARKVHEELSKRPMHGGLEPFNQDVLYINRFNNGEIDIAINTNVRGRDVFMIKSINVYPEKWDRKARQPPTLNELVYQPNEALAELEYLNDALFRAKAGEITDVLLHMPYQRQDRRPTREDRFIRGPISARVVCDKLALTGAKSLITLDPHFRQFEGFNSMPVNCLESFVLYAEYIEQNYSSIMDKVIFVSPDHGGVERTRNYATHFKSPYAIIDKRRTDAGVSEVMNIITPKALNGMTAIIIDDLIDTGGTIIKASNALKAQGAKDVLVCCTHPVLTGNAKEDLLNGHISLITTNSIHVRAIEKYPNIKIIDASYLLAGAIHCICNGDSMNEHLINYAHYKAGKTKSKASIP